jgi:hypothetical protein
MGQYSYAKHKTGIREKPLHRVVKEQSLLTDVSVRRRYTVCERVLPLEIAFGAVWVYFTPSTTPLRTSRN